MLVWINYTAIHVFFVSYWAGQSTAVLAVMEPCLGLSTTGILHQPVDQLCVVLMYAQMSLYWIRFVCVCVFLCCNCPNRAYVLTLRFLDHTHTHTHTPGRTPLSSDQPLVKAATYTAYKKHKRRTLVLLAGFEPAISAIMLLQIYALDSTTTRLY